MGWVGRVVLAGWLARWRWLAGWLAEMHAGWLPVSQLAWLAAASWLDPLGWGREHFAHSAPLFAGSACYLALRTSVTTTFKVLRTHHSSPSLFPPPHPSPTPLKCSPAASVRLSTSPALLSSSRRAWPPSRRLTSGASKSTLLRAQTLPMTVRRLGYRLCARANAPKM